MTSAKAVEPPEQARWRLGTSRDVESYRPLRVSDVTQQHENQQNYENCPQPTARTITPAPAVRPSGQGTKQHENQHNEQNRTKHFRFSFFIRTRQQAASFHNVWKRLWLCLPIRHMRPKNKKADEAEHPRVFRRVGSLTNQPPESSRAAFYRVFRSPLKNL